jgi:hypothetical protein
MKTHEQLDLDMLGHNYESSTFRPQIFCALFLRPATAVRVAAQATYLEQVCQCDAFPTRAGTDCLYRVWVQLRLRQTRMEVARPMDVTSMAAPHFLRFSPERLVRSM